MNAPPPPNQPPAEGDVSKNIVWHENTVSRAARERNLRQRGCVVWFTGLSGCGKSTIANELDRLLISRGAACTLLDGDNVRHGLCAPPAALSGEHGDAFAERFGLGFSPIDREENIRRIGAVASLMAAAGLITLAAFVSPYRRDRDRVRRIVEGDGQKGDFLEVFVDTPLEVCQQRDPKGLYKKALAGEIPNFTGISDPYEAPQQPEIHLQFRVGMTPSDAAEEILQVMTARGVFGTPVAEDKR
ncbi:adenylyl-sulfate kinase [Allorhodopirellula heiligendammensis]|uniref:Adenylyl-sulfate kinase n=1 Tax=Allorhodopirellula heiligendammensis TaxID=2714739 RepID=A0A5C6C1E4_9BACT|nr:adenylyl-sulfate kinase [Allorhodopirellula heiligendammensis]TWU17935.1 Adenylyl-sulfate kinase [Allorhodopirellula heiligendammensis]